MTTQIFRFGKSVAIGVPLASVAARLIHSKIRSMILWGSGYRGPADREEAIRQGRTGICVTIADIQELHLFKSVHAPIRARWDYETGTCLTGGTLSSQWTPKFATPSHQWDAEYFRWLSCRKPDRKMSTNFPYSHGMLSGLWQGSYLVISKCHVCIRVDCS